MSESCPVLTPAERQAQTILKRAEEAMVDAINAALERACTQAAEELQNIGSEMQPPAYDYFVAVAHQQLFLRLCGADPQTFEGGNPEIAAHLIRNAQNICDHYWTKKDAAQECSSG